MDVYDFISLATDLSGVIVSIYDMEHGEVVYESKYGCDILRDIEEQTLSEDDILSYEVESYDLFKNKDGEVCLELNISIEDDEDDEDN